jgi:hypothetical protein
MTNASDLAIKSKQLQRKWFVDARFMHVFFDYALMRMPLSFSKICAPTRRKNLLRRTNL